MRKPRVKKELLPVYLNTPEMAALIGRHADWMTARMGGYFKEGVHYFRKSGERDPFWKVEAVMEWVEDNSDSKNVDSIISKMVS
ncbi:hypothetical protein [Hydrogenimonas sp.]